MPRPLRPDFSRTYHYVVLRGIEDLRIFGTDEKRESFLALMREVRTEHDLSVYAMNFLDNRLHLFIRRNDHSLSRFFQRLKGRYTRWYNTKFDHDGTLYEDRFSSSIVDPDGYFEPVWEYVQRQGSAVGRYSSPLEDPWSTAGFYEDGRPRFRWIDWLEALSELNSSVAQNRFHWDSETVSRWLEDGPPVQRHRDHNFIADREYAEEYLRQLEESTRNDSDEDLTMTWESMLGSMEAFSGVDRDKLLENTKKRQVNMYRCLIAWAGRTYCHQSIDEMAERLNVSKPAVSKMIKRAREKHQPRLSEWETFLEDLEEDPETTSGSDDPGSSDLAEEIGDYRVR